MKDLLKILAAALLCLAATPSATAADTNTVFELPEADKNDAIGWYYVPRHDLAGFIVGVFPSWQTNAIAFAQVPAVTGNSGTNMVLFSAITNMPPRGTYDIRLLAYDTNRPPRNSGWSAPTPFKWEPEPPLPVPAGVVIINLTGTDLVLTMSSTNLTGTNVVNVP